MVGHYRIERERHPHGVVVIIPHGELTMETAGVLRQTLHEEATRRRALIVVDLTDVPFVDSVTLGVLIGGLRRARDQEGQIALVNPSESVVRLLKLTSLYRIFDVFPTVATVPWLAPPEEGSPPPYE
jgi:anti-sigma B factor antagonist